MNPMTTQKIEARAVEVDDFVLQDENTFRRVTEITRWSTDVPTLRFHFADPVVFTAHDDEDVIVLRDEVSL